MITERDQSIYNFILDFKNVTTFQIYNEFFIGKSLRQCNKRLQDLVEQEYIKRTRSTISSGYSYYIDKKALISQIHHDLIRTELYINIKKQYSLLQWDNEYRELEHIRPDAFCYINYNNIPYPIFIEIHLNNKFNYEKYINLSKNIDLKSLYGIMPRIIICTDQKLKTPQIDLKIKTIDLSMKGIETLFK